MILCAGKNETFSFAKPIGIGLIESSIFLSNFLSKNSVNELIFVGSGGLYDFDKNLFEIFESSWACNYEISNLNLDSYSPISNEIRSNVSRETYKINSSNYITKNSKIAKKFKNENFILENMEFYSVMKVGEFFKIPTYGIFIATNYCDEFAHETFIKNHKIAKEKLEEYLYKKGLI